MWDNLALLHCVEVDVVSGSEKIAVVGLSDTRICFVADALFVKVMLRSNREIRALFDKSVAFT